MGVAGHNWYNLQSTRAYPIDGTATGVDDAGLRLPTDVLVDCHLLFPSTLGKYAFVSSIAVTPRLITITFAATDEEILPSGEDELVTGPPAVFQPLAAVTVQKPISEGRHYDVTPLADGVGGWVVLGPGHGKPATHRCSSPAQSLLLPRTARSYRPLPVTSMRKQHVASALTGIVRLLPGNDIEIVKETRTIEDVVRDVIVFRLKEATDKNVYDIYRGPCATRPESGTCDRTPIRRLNTAVPDCYGNIQLNFLRVRAVPYADQVGGLTLSTSLSVADTCSRQKRLPNSIGVLPNEYNGSCSGSSYSESVPPLISSSFSLSEDPPGSSSSVSLPPRPSSSSISVPPGSSSSSEAPPDPGSGTCKNPFTITAIDPGTGDETEGDYVDTFDNGYADGFSVISGTYAVTSVADYDAGQTDTWYPAFSGTKAYSAQSVANRNLSVWTCQTGFDTNRVLEAAVRLQSGSTQNGGVAFAYYTVSGYHTYLYAYIDRVANKLKLDYFNGLAFYTVAELNVSGPGLQLNEWYVLRLYVKNTFATGQDCYRPPWVNVSYNCAHYSSSGSGGGGISSGTCPNCGSTANVHLRLTLPSPTLAHNAILPHNIAIPELGMFWMPTTKYHGLASAYSKADFGYFHLMHANNYFENLISNPTPGEVLLRVDPNSY